MAYMTQHLVTIAQCANLALNFMADGTTVDQAIDQALDSIESDCLDIIKGKRPSMTEAQVNEYRDLLGVAKDVRNQFVSPTIGNVRTYVKNEVSK